MRKVPLQVALQAAIEIYEAHWIGQAPLAKRDFENMLGDLLRELEACPGWLLGAMIDGLMAEKGCSRDEAIRELAKMETTVRHLLEASQRIGEA